MATNGGFLVVLIISYAHQLNVEFLWLNCCYVSLLIISWRTWKACDAGELLGRACVDMPAVDALHQPLLHLEAASVAGQYGQHCRSAVEAHVFYGWAWVQQQQQQQQQQQ